MSKSDRVWTVLSMLKWATDYFEKKGVPNPRLSIEWIIADVLQIKRLDIYLRYDRPFSPEELEKLRPLVKRRGNHEPLQYITGSTEFMSCSINVTQDVLIPRAETEQLVELIIQRYADHSSSLNLLDIGTGSGCIPIAIKKEFSSWRCAGIDISENALKVARQNAEHNDTDVRFFKGDLFNLESTLEISEKNWDVIVSNPPYIKNEEKTEMENEVLNFEPGIALFHEQPLRVYRKIISFASSKNAELYLECNDKYANEVLGLADQYYTDSELLKDLDGNDRFVVAVNAENRH